MVHCGEKYPLSRNENKSEDSNYRREEEWKENERRTKRRKRKKREARKKSRKRMRKDMSGGENGQGKIASRKKNG